MINTPKIYLFLFAFSVNISMAQTSMDSLILNSKKIDFENLRRVADSFSFASKSDDIFSSIYDDCNFYSDGITPAFRYCLNIQLQREDSLLKKSLNDMIENINDTLFTKETILTQEIWERYRYAHCSRCIRDEYNKWDMFSFMKCAIELTIKRREEIEKKCE